MDETFAKFRRLDPQKIIETVQSLHGRIEERFPGSGLGTVIFELLGVAEEAVKRTRWIQRPHLLLRAGAGLLSLSILLLLLELLIHIRQFQFNDFTNSVQALDASISSVVFIGAAILFLVSWENRIKRHRSLRAIHELRALAHIVDMHQLTKDPEIAVRTSLACSTPKRQMTVLELTRYLAYCSDAMALISKVAALYAQSFQDPILLDAVDDVEDLTAGFSRKIWQKITILENLQPPETQSSAKVSTAPSSPAPVL
ncbi:MAG TPA: hypothetical protein VJA21_20260 [Verrucomicrobiae bacterium]